MLESNVLQYVYINGIILLINGRNKIRNFNIFLARNEMCRFGNSVLRHIFLVYDISSGKRLVPASPDA
jgi:hypothetical protein